MNSKSRNIYEMFVQHKGLLENVLGKFGNDVLYSRKQELARLILIEAYGKTDVDVFFRPYVDQEKYKQTLDTMFTYYQNQENGRIETRNS